MKANTTKTMTKGISACGASLLAIQMGAACYAPVAAQDAVSTEGLDQITVTAQRREEDLQSTPLAITAVTGETLEQQGVVSLLDIGAIAPNVMVGSQSLRGASHGGFFIRGIGQDRSGIDFDQGVGLYVDGVYFSRSDSSLLKIIDVERIEVLRGPQGTLFGKNTIGGAIHYITKSPADEFSASFKGTVGSYDRLDIIASANIPISDRLLARATFGSLNRDGFLEHIVDDDAEGDDDTRVARLQIRALPTDTLSIDLSASHTRIRNSGRAFTVDFIDPNDLFIRRHNTNPAVDFVFDESFVSPDSYTRTGGDDTFYDYDGYNLSGIVTLDVSQALQIKSITAYMEADASTQNDWDGSFADVFNTRDDRELDQFSQEIQFSGVLGDDRLQYVTGFFYLKETPSNFNTTVGAFLPTYPDAPRIRTLDTRVKSIAVFFQGTLNVTEMLALTAGVRYSEDKKNFSNSQNGVVRNPFRPSSASWDDLSPRFAVEFEPSDNIMIYGSVTKGFRSGGINATFGSPRPDFEPEIVWNYEAGIRSDLLGNRLRLNLTGFYMDYSQQQLTALDVATNTVFIQNVGKSHRTGVEVEFQAVPADGFEIHGTLGYLDAEFDDVGTATAVTEDSRVLRSPEITLSIGGSYEILLGDRGTVTPSLDFNYRSEQSTTSSDNNTVLLDGYGLLNGRIQYRSPNDRWGLALFVTNLTDKEYFIGAFDFARREPIIGVSQLDVGRPREFGVTLEVKL